MNCRSLPFLVVATAGVLALATSIRAAESAGVEPALADVPLHAISIRYENDMLAGTDRYYSNGCSIAWTRSKSGDWLLYPIWRTLHLPANEDHHRETLGFEFAQVMNTPSDIKLVDPPRDDRPYCGLLTLATTLQVERENRLDVLKLVGGVSGPPSLCEETQKWVHKHITDSPEPMGWDTQVKSEFVFGLAYERRWRRLLAGDRTKFTIDAIPSAGAMVGNILTQAQINCQLRAGWRVPEDFGTTLLRGTGNLPPPAGVVASRGVQRGWGFYVFAGANANGVLHNIAIDGNVFRDYDRGVDSEPFFSGLEAGAVLTTRHFQGTFTWVRWSREFEAQKGPSEFAAITAAILY